VTTAHQLVNQDSGDTDYGTPPIIIEAVRLVFRAPIDLDPASSQYWNGKIGARNFYITDALVKPWYGRVWLNHPFKRGENHLWIEALVQEYQDKNIKEACCITYSATSEIWFRPLLDYPQCFLNPRTHYLKRGGIKKGATKGSVVTYLGHKKDLFKYVFQNKFKLGVVK